LEKIGNNRKRSEQSRKRRLHFHRISICFDKKAVPLSLFTPTLVHLRPHGWPLAGIKTERRKSSLADLKLKQQNQNFMKYVLDKISTVQACDALLAGAKKKKQNLERRVRNLGESLDTFRKRLDQVHQESAQIQSSLEAFTSAYGSLAEGKDKMNMKIRIKRLELQQAMAEKKATTYNVGALLAKELQYNRLHSEVATLEDYVTAVALQRLALDAPALRIVQPAVLLRQTVARPVLIPQVLLRPEINTGRMDLSYLFNVA
jgi:hypothetical protein